MLEGGPLDVLTGDYLAELTLLILGRDRAKDPARGYARTFLAQMEECLGLAADRGVRIVVNAGGLNPAGLADALRDLAARLGLPTAVAHVEGDDLLPRAADLGLGTPLTANAYLGAFGIAECLRAGADVVVTGRVTDASLVVGPGIAHFGWGRDDLDALAGAVVAGHVLECGAQATGGNLSSFDEHPLEQLLHPGFPLAELAADGSCVITKHPGTGGVVDRDTVTAQLLYEITGPRYAGPDVVARFDTIRLDDDGPDRVRISGVRGELPPPDVKVCLNALGGHRNEVTFVLTGDRIDAKAALRPGAVRGRAAGAARGARVVDRRRRAPRRRHRGRRQRAPALLGPGPLARGRRPRVQRGRRGDGAGELSRLPPDRPARQRVAVRRLHRGVRAAGRRPARRGPARRHPRRRPPAGADPPPRGVVLRAVPKSARVRRLAGRTRRAPLGAVARARSGDKGGTANVGLWARTDEAAAWLAATLTPEKVRELLPEAAELPVTVHALPNLRAVNVVIDGLLGRGVAASTRFDPQGKAVGEWLRGRTLDIPEALL